MASSPATDLSSTQAQVRSWRRAGERVGFVPTMGALHEGHLSLIRAARAHCDRVVVSVYVNEKQFGANEDLGTYPRQPETDRQLAEAEGADQVWLAKGEEVYPPGFSVAINMQGPGQGFEAVDRPDFFGGIATVVARLFGLIQPDLAAFGEKDFQQLAVIRQLVKDLALPIEILSCPLVRDHDGLALSSRNVYLQGEDRARALGLPTALVRACNTYAEGNRDVAMIVAAGTQVLAAHELDCAYFSLVDPETLRPLSGTVAPGTQARILAAVRCGSVRLIDNCALDDPPWR
ncbi:MAG: pantoate--beta-alanine ligase [Myxococcales bacterium]|nr:pantoate--beta-alanine ligase [Myxococcales bacterium]